MKPTSVRIGLVVLMVVLGMSLAGCQSIADKAAEKAAEIAVEQTTGAQIDQENGSITITGEDGTEVTASEGGELPEGFPADVPVFEGPVISSLKSGSGFMVVIETDRSVDEVKDWYKDELENSTWKVAFESTSAEGATIAAERDDATLHVTISADGDSKTTISLLYALKE